MLIATKFGGSSLADAKQFQRVREIIEGSHERQFVVPSAPGRRFAGDDKITDLLYACYALQKAGADFGEPFARIRERYMDIERELGLDCGMERELAVVERAIKNGASEDYAASRGEYLCGLLLAAYLKFAFVDANELICFHEDGTYDDATTQLWASCLEGRRGVVVPGFYGRRRDGAIKTFSRGGSDITGAIVARAVRADIYENWTDVSGFMMADPRIVENPHVISSVTYSELRELSYMGATVLHEDSIFPVRKAKIPIQVRNTNAPKALGTMVIPDAQYVPTGRACPLTGIAGRRGFTILTVNKDNMHKEVGFGYRLLRVLHRNNISFENAPSGIDTMSVIIDDAHLIGKLDTVIEQIKRDCDVQQIEVSSGIALIATVGKGMARRLGVSATLFSALCAAGVNVRVIDQGSSEMNIIVGINETDFEVALRAIYAAFEGFGTDDTLACKA
ncbi:MAG: aspartate kinase [Clostridiales bacterium]|nr:aspartate kinase [Clostridiales bacterium]